MNVEYPTKMKQLTGSTGTRPGEKEGGGREREGGRGREREGGRGRERERYYVNM